MKSALNNTCVCWVNNQYHRPICRENDPRLKLLTLYRQVNGLLSIGPVGFDDRISNQSMWWA